MAKTAAKKSRPPAKSARVKTSRSAVKTVKPRESRMVKAAPKSKTGRNIAAPASQPARPAPNDGRPISPPVASNEKPRKNQAGFNARDLEHFRDLLLAKRREILGDMSSMEREALRSSGGSNLSTLPIHMADMGTDNYEQEFTLGLVETERKLLREINLALAKIQDGTYGICEGTGKPISKARLEVQPWARYSIEYAKQMERGGR